jgi:hypothetical protein
MSTNALRKQIGDLRWLVDELGHELDALASTPYPGVHRFLMRNLATRIARVAVQVRGSLTEHPQDQQGSSNEVHLLEQSA